MKLVHISDQHNKLTEFSRTISMIHTSNCTLDGISTQRIYDDHHIVAEVYEIIVSLIPAPIVLSKIASKYNTVNAAQLYFH